MNFQFSAALALDAYKFGHRQMYPEGTQVVYSNFTARNDKYSPVPANLRDGHIVVAGISSMLQELVASWDETFFKRDLNEVLVEYRLETAPFQGVTPEEVETDHLVQLHEYGRLPISFLTFNEGELVPLQVPIFVLLNTTTWGFWVTNYLETILSSEGWKPCVNATTALAFRRVFEKYAEETGTDRAFVNWQGHDFSMRGMSGIHDAGRCGASHALVFTGSDTVPAAQYLRKYYRGGETFMLGSVPASEHSVATMGGPEGEFEILDRIAFNQYPKGVVSLVADSYDFFNVVTNYAASRKERILARQENAYGMAKVVFRPDSGDPVEILCGVDIDDIEGAKNPEKAYKMWAERQIEEAVIVLGTVIILSGYFRFEGEVYSASIHVEYTDENEGYLRYPGPYSVVELTPEMKGAVECLWQVFGGTITEKGYKLLDRHVGLIYGDSITLERAIKIMERLKSKGFASGNWVAGIGSYTYNLVSRDSQSLAMKATWGVVDGENREIFKQPKTDPGKNSAKGLLSVYRGDDGEWECRDQATGYEAFTETGHTWALRDGVIQQDYLDDNTLIKARERVRECAGIHGVKP